MAQHAKPIDITRSFVLTDPNAFPNNQGFTQGEDTPEKLPPIGAFEGYNFIPTSYGYKSFFGANSTLNIQALSSRCDRIFLFQLMNYQNILVALCEDGLWVCFPSHPGNTWSQWVVQATPAAGTYREWTTCVIENNLYCYREGDTVVHKISPLGTALNVAVVPSTITFGAPYANAEANVVAGTYDITVAQIVAGVPSSVTTTAGSITLALGQAFDVILAGYIGSAILYFTHQTTGVIYKQTVAGLTVAPQSFLALTVASTDSKAQGLPDPDAFDYITNFTPSFLNMTGQKGIFRANARLGFWDSANSISWSDLAIVTDFTPSVETRAGYAIFSGVKGRIVTILAQGDGFIIYTTKGIVGARFVNDLSLIWEASSISDTAGIAYDREVTSGVTDLEHFAYTNTGIKRIGSFNALSKSHQFEDILPDVFDLLKEQREPVYLDFLNGRFLFLSVINANYIYSKTSFVYNTIDTVTVRVLTQGAPWNGVSTLPIKIGAKTVEVSIKEQLAAAAYLGQYSAWAGTGKSMYTFLTTPMHEYVIDDSSVHIDNSPIDSTKTFDFVGNASSSLVETGLGNCVPDNANSPSALDLGWTFPGINNTGSAYLGLVDSYLNEFVATQMEEWANFTTIQTANKAAIEAVPSYTAPVVQGSTPYLSSAAAQAQINILVAAGGGTGNSYVVSNDNIGSLLSGAGTTAAASLTGVGTYHASYSLTRTFLGGWDVYRKKTRTYSVRVVTRAPVGYGYYVTAGNWGPAGSWSVPPPTTAIGDCFGEATTAVQAVRNCMLQVIAQLPQTFSATESGQIYNASNPVFPLGSASITWTVSFPNYPPFPYIGEGYNLILKLSGTGPNAVTQVTEYFIDYTDVTILETVVNETITLDSTLTASQKTLEWAYIPQGIPAGSFTSTYGAITIPGSGITGTSFLPLDLDITYPGANFLIDNGSPAPIYPTFAGSLVFDTGLKKWGKNKNSYRTILDMAPINSIDSSINFTNFGVNMAQLDAAGVVKVYDSRPTDSWIRYGKIGYYRQGVTQIQEVRAGFRNSSSGNIIIDTSIDGRALELSLQSIYPFSAAADVIGYFSGIGKWHTVTVSGQWDLQYLEFRGNSAGRR